MMLRWSPQVPSHQCFDPGGKRGRLSRAPAKVSGEAFIGSARVMCPSIHTSQGRWNILIG